MATASSAWAGGSLASAGSGPPGRLARRAGLRRPDRLDLRQRHRGPAGAAGGPLLPGRPRARGRCGLWRQGFYRFYDHVVGAPPTTTRWRTSPAASSRRWPSAGRARDPGVALHARVRRLARRAGSRRVGSPRRASATACRCSSRRRPTARSPRAIARRGAKGPVVDFFADYEIALRIMDRYMPPGPGTSRSSWAAACRRTSSRSPRRASRRSAATADPVRTWPRSRSRPTTPVSAASGAPPWQRVHLVGQGERWTASTSCSSPTSRSRCRSSARGCSSATARATCGRPRGHRPDAGGAAGRVIG